MKVHILTWHKSLNHGAVLQAYGSQQVIKAIGHEPIILNYDRIVKNNENTILRIKKMILACNPLRSSYRYNVQKMLNEKKKIFNTFIDQELNVGEACNSGIYDCTMIGSDMVFSLAQGFNPYMFGIGYESKYLFSYAASAGGSTLQTARDMKVEDKIAKALREFNGLGCRDAETSRFINDISARSDIIENIDPVLLYGFADERKNWDTGKWRQHKPYIMLYSYTGNMDKKSETEQIQSYAKKHGQPVVSCGYYHPWCDENVNASPKEFVEMISNASAVVTDTFHGTVFSLIFNVPFVSFIRGNSFKLEYLLCQCEMSERIAYETKQIFGKLEEPCNFTSFNRWVSRERVKSLEYIKAQIQ